MEVGAARRGLATGPPLRGWAALGAGRWMRGSRGICWGIFRLRGWSGIADWLGAGKAGHVRPTARLVVAGNHKGNWQLGSFLWARLRAGLRPSRLSGWAA